jgi:hypothetical protein
MSDNVVQFRPGQPGNDAIDDARHEPTSLHGIKCSLAAFLASYSGTGAALPRSYLNLHDRIAALRLSVGALEDAFSWLRESYDTYPSADEIVDAVVHFGVDGECIDLDSVSDAKIIALMAELPVDRFKGLTDWDREFILSIGSPESQRRRRLSPKQRFQCYRFLGNRNYPWDDLPLFQPAIDYLTNVKGYPPKVIAAVMRYVAGNLERGWL